MDKIENVRKIKHYVSAIDSRTYGIYECEINGKKEVLVRRGMDVALVRIWLSEPITKSLSIVRYDMARELIEIVDKKSKMTNADKIGNMTDEELAEWLYNMCDYIGKDEEPYKSIYNLDTKEEEGIHDGYGDLLNWLRSEAE